MITCTICERTTRRGQKGTSWICEDCKVGNKEEKETNEEGTSGKSDPGENTAK